MELRDKIEKRELLPYHIFMASFLAGLNEMGMLNQASVNVASRRAGKYLAEYIRAKGVFQPESTSRFDKARQLINHLDSLLQLGTKLLVEAGPDGTECAVISMGCKFCPKGVGEAELKGTLCPYPGLIEQFVNELIAPLPPMKLKMTNRRQLVKSADRCIVKLK